MKKINIREALLELDRKTSCKYDLTTLYEACKLDDEDKTQLVKYIASYDHPSVIGGFLATKCDALSEDVDDDVTEEDMKKVVDDINDGEDHTLWALMDKADKLDECYDESDDLEEDKNWRTNPSNRKEVRSYVWNKIRSNDEFTADESHYWGFDTDVSNGTEAVLLTDVKQLPEGEDDVPAYSFSLQDDNVDFDFYYDWNKETWYIIDHNADLEESALGAAAMALGTAAATGFGQSLGDKVGSKLLGETVDDEAELEEGVFELSDDWEDYCPHCTNRSLKSVGNGRAVCDSCGDEFEVIPMGNDKVRIVDLKESAEEVSDDSFVQYTFPTFTELDAVKAKYYGLQIDDENEAGTVVSGAYKDVKYFADKWLGYELVDDYLNILEEGIWDDIKKVGKAVGTEIKNSKVYKNNIGAAQKAIKNKVDKIKSTDAYKNISGAVKETDTYKKVKGTVDAVKGVIKDVKADSKRNASDYMETVKGKNYAVSDLSYTLNGKEISPDEYIKLNGFQRKKAKVTVPNGVKPVKESLILLTEDMLPYDKDMEFNDRYFPRVNTNDTGRYEFVEHKDKYFAYDKQHNILIYLFKDDEEVSKLGWDNAPWRELDSAGLSADSWNDPEMRPQYLDDYTNDLDDEASYLAQDFIKNELPFYQQNESVEDELTVKSVKKSFKSAKTEDEFNAAKEQMKELVNKGISIQDEIEVLNAHRKAGIRLGLVSGKLKNIGDDGHVVDEAVGTLERPMSALGGTLSSVLLAHKDEVDTLYDKRDALDFLDRILPEVKNKGYVTKEVMPNIMRGANPVVYFYNIMLKGDGDGTDKGGAVSKQSKIKKWARESLTEAVPSQGILDDCLQDYKENAFGFDGVEDYVETQFPMHAPNFKQAIIDYLKKNESLSEDYEVVYDKDGNEIEPPLGRCECGRALIAGEDEEPHCAHCDRRTYDDDYYMLEEAEDNSEELQSTKEGNKQSKFANNIDKSILHELNSDIPEEPVLGHLEKCSKSATLNALYYVNKGEEVTFNLGNIDKPHWQITHCWITHNGEVLQTRNDKYPDKLITKYSIDLTPGDVDKAITDIKNLVNSINGSDTANESKSNEEEMIPYSKEEIQKELKSLTSNFTVESDTLKCGFKEEAEYSEEILSQYYASVEVDKVGSWFQVDFCDLIAKD